MSGHDREIPVQRPFHIKAGLKTTEFWISLFVVLACSTLVAIEARTKGLDVNGAIAVASAALTSFGYSRSRALVKAGR